MALNYDFGYIKTISGMIKVLSLICCQCGFLSLVVSEVKLRNARALFYSTVIWLTFITTTIIICLRIYSPLHWKWPSRTSITSIKYEFYTLSFLALACFAASAVAITLDMLSYTIATFFGLCVFLCCCYDAFWSYKLSRAYNVQTQTDHNAVHI